MQDGAEYTLSIEAYTPDTMPMGRLAEYMADLARLLGEERMVHFVRLDPGSTKLVHRVETEATTKVRERVTFASRGDGPADAVKAIRSINKRLKEDNGSGVLAETKGATIIEFPGRDEEDDDFFATISEHSDIDGIVVRVGGLGDWIPVHLEVQPGIVITVQAKRHIAKAMAAHLWGRPLRAKGPATWIRGLGGVWRLHRLYVESFDVLDDSPLSDVIRDLRNIEGNEWPTVADAWSELDRLRYGESDTVQWS